ncbi:ODV-E56, per os infectivity factor 6 [Diatraea saccharalis granulovirus]|uniref:ODV-E56, per os infectivity factor 6 n=1 Tax=Diatraea saccharalis granulovirus TaxID=1675862 RepID=A0A0R7EYW3_9BBAC|nr:ODV-E56, per os infectivity factor 6 [Diatraea saccharalis granulovirus]AKN80774.1 ODV-E56, per os infectivity factor 6 [Diatraea saccharalis granulovirus]
MKNRPLYIYTITYDKIMTSFFSGLRRTNKVYPNTNSFLNDHTLFIRNRTPAGINLNNPVTTNIPGSTNVRPGFNINNSFVSNANINSMLRNNDITNIRQTFPSINNNQMNGLRNLRRADNIPDSTFHTLQTRKANVKRSNPETAVRDRSGVENALANNPRLANYLRGAGYVTLFGAGVYLIINVADLVGSIVEALNRTGGSWYFRGNNGAEGFDNIQACVLRYRSCGMPFADIQNDVCVLDPHDPNIVDPLMTIEEARTFCTGYNREREGTVCRGSDTNADPDSFQYLDISLLPTNQTIQCVEPYDFGDLIADLGLESLLGENGVLTASFDSSQSVTDNFFTIIIVIGGLLLLALIIFIIFKIIMYKKAAEVITT